MRVLHASLLCFGMTFLGASVGAQESSSDQDSPSDVVQLDRDAIAGKWSIARLVVDGKPSKPADVRQLFVVNEANGDWSLTSDNKVVAKGTSKLDPTTTPKSIDFVTVGGDDDGKKYLGIYQVGKSGRKMCFALEGDERPTRFNSKAGSDHVLVEFQRFPEPRRLKLIEERN